MVLVSTHDFELCDLTDGQGNAVTNYHFEEYYEDERLLFDYKIKDGRCTTRNAMAILKLAGLGD
jgi:DNA mismatch repair ATPase MutS